MLRGVMRGALKAGESYLAEGAEARVHFRSMGDLLVVAAGLCEVAGEFVGLRGAEEDGVLE